MAITKVIEIDVDELKAVGGLQNLDKAIAEADKQTASLKTQLREATQELIRAQDEYGEYSKAALDAAKRVAGLKDQIQEAKETSQLFDPGAKFQAATGAISAGANAVQTYQAALGLLGVESESVQESLLKVQSAMALSQGLSGIADSAKDFQRLGAVAKQALSGIRAGIAATGIGLLVVALGSIVAYWDDIKEAVNGVSSEQEKLNELASKNLTAEQGKLDAIGGQENILKLQGKSERDILKIKVAQTDQVIKATENQIIQNDITAKAQIEAAQRNKDILKGILDFLSIPFQTVLETIDMIGKAVGQDFGLTEMFDKLLDKGSSLLFDPEAEKAAAEKTRQEGLKTLEKLKNDRAGFQLSIKSIDDQAAKEASAKRKEELEKRIAEEKEAFKRQSEIINEGLKIAKTNDEKRLEDLKAFGQKKSEEIFKQLKAEQDRADKEIEIEKAVAAAKVEIQNQVLDTALSGINVLKGLFEKNKGLQKAALIAESAIGISKIVINTQAANAAAKLKYALLPGGQALAAAEITLNKVSAGIGIAANIAATAKGLSALGGGGGAGGSSPNLGGAGGGTATAPQFNVVGNAGVNQIANTINQPPLQAYVVAGQVTTQQSLDRNIVSNATIG
jgi:hypothetical protein